MAGQRECGGLRQGLLRLPIFWALGAWSELTFRPKPFSVKMLANLLVVPVSLR